MVPSLCFFLLGLSLLCDHFFVPSVKAISGSFHISEDITGAIFMAIGSSSPEFSTLVAEVALKRNIGIETIIGCVHGLGYLAHCSYHYTIIKLHNIMMLCAWEVRYNV